MANTLKLGAGKWATGTDTVLAFNDENNNFKPLPFNFSRASSATVVNQSGLIETVGSGEPRIDFQGNTKGALLLEPQRSNDILYSQDFSNAAWAKGGTSVTSGFVSPDGTLNADKITPTGINEAHQIYQNKTITSNQSYTISVFMKFGGYRYLECRETFGGKGIGFDTTTQTFYGINTPTSFKGVILKNGWVRMEATYTSIGTSAFFLLYSTPILMNPTFLGDGTSYFYTYGAQLEQGSYATSYIPTNGSTVQRAAETCNGSGNSEVFNDSEGVLMAEISALADDLTFRNISISDGSNSNMMSFRYRSTSNVLQALLVVGDVGETYGVTLNDITTFSKAAIKYKENDVAFWVNGFEMVVDTSASTFPNNTLNTLNFQRGNDTLPFYGNTKQIQYFDSALTDAELEYMTSYRSLNEMVTELNLNAL